MNTTIKVDDDELNPSSLALRPTSPLRYGREIRSRSLGAEGEECHWPIVIWKLLEENLSLSPCN
jgi:hypothetical protein